MLINRYSQKEKPLFHCQCKKTWPIPPQHNAFRTQRLIEIVYSKNVTFLNVLDIKLVGRVNGWQSGFICRILCRSVGYFCAKEYLEIPHFDKIR